MNLVFIDKFKSVICIFVKIKSNLWSLLCNCFKFFNLLHTYFYFKNNKLLQKKINNLTH